jgi:SAM-dependent methyltransferase
MPHTPLHADAPLSSCGLASLDDLQLPELKESLARLEEIQAEFLHASPHTPGYLWVRDALHGPMRVWEYPYVMAQLLRERAATDTPCVLDLGSGCTFFPFAVARHGFNVVAVDSDPESGRSFDRALPNVSCSPGSVRFLEADIRAIPMESQSVDHAYCVSVLEHVEPAESPIAEVARVMKPGGIFALTVDIDLSGIFAIGPAGFGTLSKELHRWFDLDLPLRFVHPMRILDSDNSPFPLYGPRTISQLLLAPARRLANLLLRRPREERLHCATFGAAFRRRSTKGP